MADPTQTCRTCRRSVAVADAGRGFPPDVAKRKLQRLCRAAGHEADPQYRAGFVVAGPYVGQFAPVRRQHDPGALVEEPDLYPKTHDPEGERRAEDAHMAAGEAWMEYDAAQGEGGAR